MTLQEESARDDNSNVVIDMEAATADAAPGDSSSAADIELQKFVDEGEPSETQFQDTQDTLAASADTVDSAATSGSKLKNWFRSRDWRPWAIYYILASESLSFTIMQPFISQMAMERFGVEKEDLGFAVGLVSGAGLLSRFVSSSYIGHLSDKYGRRWFLIGSLVVSTISVAVFGFVNSLWLAITTRVIEGFLGATGTLCRTVIVDISSDSNRAQMLAYLGAVFALARTMSSALGGLTVGAAELLQIQNPYMPACLIGAAIVAAALIAAVLLPETNKLRLLELEEKRRRKQEAEETTSAAVAAPAPTRRPQRSFLSGLKVTFSDRLTSFLTVIFGINSLCNGSLFTLFVLMFSEPPPHGLGLDASLIGVYFFVFGLVGFLFQVSFFDKLIKKFGLLKVYRIGAVMQTLQALLFPAAASGFLLFGVPSEDNNTKTITYGIAFTVLAVHAVLSGAGFMLMLPVVQAMFVNTTRHSIQGLVQGTTQSIGTFLRAIGPIGFGALYSLCLKVGAAWLIFIFVGCLYALTLGMSFFLPASVEKRKIFEDDMEVQPPIVETELSKFDLGNEDEINETVLDEVVEAAATELQDIAVIKEEAEQKS